MTELSKGTSSAEPTADGLVFSATLTLGEGDHELVVEVKPRGFGALRMTAPDGRIAHFPRAHSPTSAPLTTHNLQLRTRSTDEHSDHG